MDKKQENLEHIPPINASPSFAQRSGKAGSSPPRHASDSDELIRRVELLECRCAALEAGGPLAAVIPLLERIANAVAPEPAAIVGTPYVAQKLDCTTVWVAEMVRKGEIPRACVVPGTGTGKVWKFYRDKIDAWVSGR